MVQRYFSNTFQPVQLTPNPNIDNMMALAFERKREKNINAMRMAQNARAEENQQWRREDRPGDKAFQEETRDHTRTKREGEVEDRPGDKTFKKETREKMREQWAR